MVDSADYTESSAIISGIQNVSSSSTNECSIKENDNSVSGNGNNSLRNESSKSGNASSKSENDTKADGADIRPIYDTYSLELVHNNDYNVFSIEKEHLVKPESVNDTYLLEQGDSNPNPDSSDMSNDGGEADQDDAKEKECALYASLIKTLKVEIDENKKINKDPRQTNVSLGKQLEWYQYMKCVKESESKCAKAYSLREEQKFSNEIDHRLKEHFYNDHMNAIIGVLTTLNEYSDMSWNKEKALKELNDSLIAELNHKTLEVKDLRAQKPPLQTLRNQLVVRQPTTFKFERSQFSKSRFASQVVEKPVTPHSLPKVREFVVAKPHRVIAPGLSRNNSKIVSKLSPKESIGSDDMVHKYYLKEARKKEQLQKDQALNSLPSVPKSARLPNTSNGIKPKPRNSSQQTRNWPPSMSSRVSNKVVQKGAKQPSNLKSFLNSKHLACPTCKKCIYTANHDALILQYLSEVNSRASTQTKDAQSHKTTKR
ncbi:hypothetical protein Tco_0155693 [Tanacetum coccineum]